jgi:hypothetical protein
MNWKRIVVTVSATAIVVAIAALDPSEAQAHRRHGGRSIVGGGLYGFGPQFGFGWGYGFGSFYGPFFDPYYGPYAPRAEGGIDPNVAMMAGLGAIDLNVKPNQAEVWVDGKYVGEARNLDGTPSYLWLPEGAHRLSIRKGGYATFETQVDVRRGITKALKLRLRDGDVEGPAHTTTGSI